MIRRGAVVGVVGAVVTVAAAALVFAPEAVAAFAPVDALTTAISTQDPRVIIVAVAIFFGLLSLTLSRSGRGDRSSAPTRRLVDRPPEAVDETVGTRPGGTITHQVGRAVDGDTTAADTVRETLRTSALRALTRDPAVDRDAAEETIRAGTWTDDSVAAAYLGEPRPPLSARLREWLDPEAERRRRIERTVTAIEAVVEARQS